MPVDKFGRMSDTKTKDTGVSLTYINNNYVRSDGETPLTGSLDMRGNTIYNVADPVNPQDVVTKVYVDNTKGSGVIGRKIGDSVSIKENLDFLGKQKIKNLPDPVNDKDAVTKEYVDTTIVPFLKLDQTKYNTKGDIDMRGLYTVYNVKKPNNDSHIVDKKYVDEMDNLKSAFTLINGGYEARGSLYMRKNKLGGLREPTMDGEAATKKYVDNLQTQYIDKKGNVKFDRDINVGNNRIFALKYPKKDYEATNKKYVDESITKRLEEEKDKFLPQDPATKQYVDEAIKGLAGGDVLVSKEGVFIKENGHYRATAPLDIDNQKMENVPDPVDEKDAVNKKYIDETFKELTLKQGLIRENGGFNLVDSYINMNFNNIRNVGLPQHSEDAVPRSFLDGEIRAVEEKIKKRKQLITVHARYCGPLEEGDYPFKFGGNSLEICEEIINENLRIKGLISGFVMPHSGRIKKIICESVTYIKENKIVDKLINSFNEEQIKELKKHFGKEDFKSDLLKTILNKVDFINENNEEKKTFFKIVKFEKAFTDKEKYGGGVGIPFTLFKIPSPWLTESVIIEKFIWSEIELSRLTGIRAIMKILNNEIIPLNEGDTINIVISDFQKNLFSEGELLDNILNLTVIRLLGELNFNFTFLIELDPL